MRTVRASPFFYRVARVRLNRLRWSDYSGGAAANQLDDGIGYTLVSVRFFWRGTACSGHSTDETDGQSQRGRIIDVRPEIEVLSLALDSSVDSRWRIQG